MCESRERCQRFNSILYSACWKSSIYRHIIVEERVQVEGRHITHHPSTYTYLRYNIWYSYTIQVGVEKGVACIQFV